MPGKKKKKLPEVMGQEPPEYELPGRMSWSLC